MGRGTNPTGPFYDVDGIALTKWDLSEDENGYSILLDAEGGQEVPGHSICRVGVTHTILDTPNWLLMSYMWVWIASESASCIGSATDLRSGLLSR